VVAIYKGDAGMKISHIGLLFGLIGLGGAIPTFATPTSTCAVTGNLVNNCGFQSGDFTDWTVTGTVSSNFGVTSNVPNSGTYDARFGDTTLDYIDQSFSTGVGTYSVSFYVDATVPGNVVSNNGQFVVLWDGSNVISMTGSTYPTPYCTGPDSSGYDLCSFTENVTTAGTSDIKFGGATAAAYYHLDDVTVTQNASTVPEPSSISFALVGLFSVFVAGRRYMEKRSKA
jgi:hypothetical protein